jgi:phosphatidylinositol alpha-mannosyltransferase
VTARRIDYRIAVSKGAAATAEPYLGGPFEVIPNGVPVPSEADPGGRSRNAVFIGRVDARKGLDVLLHAWPEVARRTGARLRILGADPLSVRWLMRRHGLSGEGVDILGTVSEEERTRELRDASLLVAPSIGRESFGLVLVEAFACATPVVASNIDGYVDVVEEGTGLLVPPGDPGALARALIELLEDEKRRGSLGARAREVAEARYAWPKIVGRTVEIYESLLGAPVGARAAAR